MQLPILPAPTTANLVYPDMSRHYPTASVGEVWVQLSGELSISFSSFSHPLYIYFFLSDMLVIYLRYNTTFTEIARAGNVTAH